jgi:hypothetical protein
MNLLNTIIDMIRYIFSLRISDILLHIAYIGVIAMVGYCVSMILIGFPCSLIESIAKKKIISDELENKIIRIVTICLSVVLTIILLYELSIDKY